MTKPTRNHGYLSLLSPLIVFLLVLIAVVFALNSIGQTTAEERVKSAEESLERAAVQCYAIEGRYPPDIDYLSQYYGLILDRDRFVYHYESQGNNILPQISVFSLQTGY